MRRSARCTGRPGWAARGALTLALALAGCTEMVRWPDRMNAPGPGGVGVAPAPEGFHVVRPGDTVYSIAFRHQIDFRELAVWNDIGGDYLIRPGDLIRLTPPPAVDGGIQTRPLQPRDDPRGPPVVTAPPVVAAPTPGPVRWEWPAEGAVAKSFGQDGNKGIDIAGQLGAPVRATAAGTVVYSGSALKGYGELIIVKHDETRLSAYGYNRRRLVQEGDSVAAGQPIAELGLGPEQKPLLHFEIRERGKPVDPLRLLPRFTGGGSGWPRRSACASAGRSHRWSRLRRCAPARALRRRRRGRSRHAGRRACDR